MLCCTFCHLLQELRQKNYAVIEAMTKLEKMAGSAIQLKDDVARKDSEIKHLLELISERKVKILLVAVFVNTFLQFLLIK